MLRVTEGCVLVHFCIVGDNHEKAFLRMKGELEDPNSRIRQDPLGRYVTMIKKWELSDGKAFVFVSF